MRQILRTAHGLRNQFDLLFRIALALLQLLGYRQNHREEIIEVVRNRSRNSPDEIDFSCQFRIPPRRWSWQQIANHEKSRWAVIPQQRKGPNLYWKQRPVGEDM